VSTTKLVGAFLGVIAVGAPMVWVLWEALNDLLSGVLDGRRLLIALPVLVLFLVYAAFVGRLVQRWEES
jgi:hypothetical protein